MLTLGSSNLNTNSLAADVRSTDSLRLLAKQSPDKAARAAAQQFESLLMQQMLSSMRAASPASDLLDSSASKMFRGLQDQQLSTSWSQNGGVGLADSIVRQIQVQQDPSLLKKPLHQLTNLANGIALASGGKVALTGKNDVAAAKDAAVTAQKPASSDFLSQVLSAAGDVADSLGVSPQVLAAHAALETGWGKKPIKTDDGSDSHNLFGIKAGSSWQGKTVDVTTTEYVNGQAQKRVEKFRAYDSYSAAFTDYAQLIKKRFGDAVGQGSDALGFGKALQQSGYATDPNYASKLAHVADRVARVTRQMNDASSASLA
ncbi:flagellar assembly peptidoglycan hydrolase FlgJ [Andreprevotia chitinilytica]|uniref:flagellar assembly peptidoglycan hydrolase FlgJ n=1 Tax=Andreprevotia chitinilytica TaxID=396808 RepID=UPI00068922A2|nr:flagellar assembly peptidoglycan hydrolase FlgJ [Andreprevotia chitinilytica]